MWAAAALYRSPTRRGFTREEAAALAALESAIADGIRTSLLADATSPWRDVTTEPAVVTVDGAGRLTQATPLGMDRLTDLGWDRSHHLPTVIRMTVAAARARTVGATVTAVARTRLPTGEWVVIRAASLAAANDPELVTVSIDPVSATDRLGIAIDAYGLNEREAEVIRGIAAGATMDDLTATLGLTRRAVQHIVLQVVDRIGPAHRGGVIARLIDTAFWPRDVSSAGADRPSDDADETPRDLVDLTSRQREVLALVAKGYTNSRIATKLCIAEGTVRKHIEMILTTLGAPNRAAAAAMWSAYITR